MRRLSNRWRITSWILCVVMIVTVITGAVAVTLVKQRLTTDIDQELRDEAAGIIAVLDVVDPEVLARLSDEPGLAASTHAIVLVGADGVELILKSGTPDSRDAPPDVGPIGLTELRSRDGEPFAVDSVDGEVHYRALSTQLADGTVAVVAQNLDERDHAVRTLFHVLLAAALVAAVVLAVVVSLVSGHVTRPLEAMITTAEGIGSGALQARVPTEGVEDVHRLASALNAMLDRLEASESKLRRFVADASHELRTPLSAILGYAQLHQDGMASSPEQVDRAMERIGVEGERMRVLVEELLLLARLDDGAAPDPQPVDVGALVSEAVAAFGDRPVTLTTPAGAPAVVVGDAASLRRAVDNLLANTRAHTPVGTPVAVTVGVVGSDVVVTVADEGPGLTAEEAAHVFERFYRAERSRARPGGSGLGLAIVEAIAHAHGGRATVSSVVGSGATFTLTVPAQAPMA